MFQRGVLMGEQIVDGRTRRTYGYSSIHEGFRVLPPQTIEEILHNTEMEAQDRSRIDASERYVQ